MYFSAMADSTGRKRMPGWKSSARNDELAYKLTASLWKNHGALVKVHGNWKNVVFADALKAAAIPVHPGVAKYYKDKGL